MCAARSQARILVSSSGAAAHCLGSAGLSARSLSELFDLQGAWDEHRWAGKIHSGVLGRRTARGDGSRSRALRVDCLDAIGWPADEDRFSPGAQAAAAQLCRLLLATQLAKALAHTRVRVCTYDPRELLAETAGARAGAGLSLIHI